jgi:hypothetical protein
MEAVPVVSNRPIAAHGLHSTSLNMAIDPFQSERSPLALFRHYEHTLQPAFRTNLQMFLEQSV